MTDNAHTPIHIAGKRYQLVQEIGSGGMGTVYEVRDRLSGEAIALKRVIAPTRKTALGTITSGDFRLSLALEFKTLASLRHPNIISVLDYGFDVERQPYFTMELLRDARDILSYGQTQTYADQVRLLVEMLQALAYLHRRGIIHRDLKPANILVAGNQVKVLDFGLSMMANEEDHGERTSGTLAYMAPEMLSGGQVTKQSDLYALGIIMHELLLGRHPFNKMNITQLIDETLNRAPDLSILEPSLRLVVARLLEKDPAKRFENANEVLNTLRKALNEPIPIETSATRESFLQAARFVGRGEELTALTGMLSDALQGKGSACLIAGESGVGKSRLVDEVRTLAQVQGVFALRGQAVAESGSPYQLLREALRWLCLTAELTPLEASVLKAVIPDIDVLLEQPVADAPPLDPQAARLRLYSTIESVFVRQEHPMLLVLEDLHWAGESLSLLGLLFRVAMQRPIFIIGTYRDDERPRLPDELPDAKVIRLSRLTVEQIAELSESMVGEGGRDPSVVNLLQRETEGNAFFLVEVMRVLAETIGNLEDISTKTLPQSVIAGGINQIVRRRLDRVPASYRPLLNFAAVAGRMLDLNILHKAAPDLDLNLWLATCAELAVLDVQEGRWRFAHDKLREGMLKSLGADELRDLHGQVAAAMEACYSEAPEYITTLAFHWAAAGNAEKELRYTILAGTQANRTGASRDAIRYYSRVFELDASLRGKNTTITDLDRARWSRALGQAYVGVGNFQSAMSQLRRALTLLGFPEPTNKRRLILSILRNIAQQIRHRVGMPKPDVANTTRLTEAAGAHLLLSELYYFSNVRLPALNSSLNALNLSERTVPSVEMAQAYSAFCVMLGILARHRWSESYGNRAQEVARSLKDEAALARVLARVGLHLLSVADFKAAQPAYSEAADTFDRIGDLVEWGRSANALAYTHFFLTRYEDMLQRADKIYAVASRRRDAQQQAWALDMKSICLMRMGRLGEARDVIEQSLLVLKTLDDPSARTRISAFVGRLYAVLGEVEKAKPYLQEALQLIEDHQSVNSYNLFQAHTAVIEGYMALGTAGIAPAKRCAEILMKITGPFPIALPNAYYCQGMIAEAEGNKEAALKAMQRSANEAHQRTLAYEEARAWAAIGRLSHNRSLLERAREVFQRIGATYDLEQVNVLLA